MRRTERTPPEFTLGEEEEDSDKTRKKRSGIAAHLRATKLSQTVGTYSASAPASRRNSFDGQMDFGLAHELSNLSNVTPDDLGSQSTDEDDAPETPREYKEAGKLLHGHGGHGRYLNEEDLYHIEMSDLRSGQVTPVNNMEIDNEHIPRPPKFRTGVLGTLMKMSSTLQAPAPRLAAASARQLSKASGHERNPSSGSMAFSDTSTLNSPLPSPGLPPSDTPSPSKQRRRWYSRSANASTSSLTHLLDSASVLAAPGQKEHSYEMHEQTKKKRPGPGKRTKSSTSFGTIGSALKGPKSSARGDQIRIQVHVAGVLSRQNYLRKLCKALMMYGAPTHRLEEYLNMSARVLEIEAQFLYMPGCMIMAFDDSSVHTSEVKLVRTSQGVDLGKLQDVHEIYKDVVHDRINVEDATPRLEAIMRRGARYNIWLRVPIYGLASAMVGPFAFEARLIDLPFCFVLGCILGWLQLIVAPKHELITNVFEICAAVITSFLARALGSARHNGKEIFCFSAMAQSSIALILPGFTVLSASLELQSRHLVAGSVRMVFSILYSLLLGFGITIGTVLYGIMDKNATSATTCKGPIASHWYYFFVIGFSVTLCLINQAKVKQMPVMVTISLIGYAVSFNSSQYFKGNSQVSSTLGALAIGFTANLHARFSRHIDNWTLDMYENNIRPRLVRIRKWWLRRNHGPRRFWANSKNTNGYFQHSHPESSSHYKFITHDVTPLESPGYIPRTRRVGFGLAAAAMLPAIFVQVPSGLSVSGSLVGGLASADQITRNQTGVTTVNGSQANSGMVSSVALQVGFSVIQVAIGITVGLFLSALLVYPLGKRRSGLFSF
ncbi:DUF1212-domain-containing protein [Sporormia fimetaria CBS 119925]|uniref:DUF1212-domain-containing protein n=1 Tax=Sporormia fimetaria CBS 119925 TaxID=1340428 RepID=A0A6A6UVT0_9PLEO|nr:DUF1212-domain-containing protein [Sporormia fimetaria CBS 119925]